jgi:hypothetical protein
LLIYEIAAQKVLRIAETAGSEAKLQIGLEPILQGLLAQHRIKYDPAVNESLTRLGFSQMSSERPDSLFGHVVLDYKDPGLLARPQELAKAESQVESYLNEVTDGGPSFNPGESAKWAGVLWDGYHLTFCHATGLEWSWSKLHKTSEASLLSLVQIYRSLGRLPLTSSLLTKYFGKNSDVAKATLLVMCSHLSKPKHRTNLLFREWKRLFQQVSTYGLSQLPSLQEWSQRNGIATRDASQILFAMHTYYSLVVKLLTAELLGATQVDREASVVETIANAPDDKSLYRELVKLENGDFFRKYRISNFLEGDFFSWYTNEDSNQLAKSIQAIACTFQEFEPATAKLKPEVVKDLLKEFYSSLVDEQIRHDLGEYYTPDWLAEYLLDRLGYEGELGKVIIDPACGSGTFVVECIKRLRRKCEQADFSPLETLQTVLQCVRGLDLNPLAVISARANYILAIADLVFSLGHDVEIPVYLADSINVPVEKSDGLLEYTLDTEVGDIKFTIPLELVREQVLGKVLLQCEDFINQNRTAGQFWASLTKDASISHLLGKIAEESLVNFYESIQSLNMREPPWDSIWCRIVKNNFSPRGFANVDYIVGNPPWVRWSRLPETYRKRVKRFCDHYGLVSGRSYTGGIESDISTVLTFSAVDHWLKDGGRIGFLITCPVFKSGSATGFRIGRLPDSSGIRIDRIEELSSIKPFPDASNETSIYVATKVKTAGEAEFSQVPCRIWYPKESARIPPSLSLAEVSERVVFEDGEACPVGEFGSPLFMGRKADYKEAAPLRGKSEDYLRRAHRGTVTDLARVYWVRVDKYSPETNRALVHTLTKKELPGARMVEPTQGAWIEADILFPLLRGRDVGRYCAKSQGWYQIIPNRHYAKFETEDEFADAYPATYSYLMNYADLLPERSTYKRYQRKLGLPIYSIYCVGDYSFNSYKVVWLEQQNPKNFRAAVVTEDEGSVLPKKVVVPDHKLYFAVVDSLREAHYLCAFLNSHPVRTWLGGFLIGKQIGSTIFEFMRVPKFDAQDSDHQRLAEISELAHAEREGTRNTKLLSEKVEREVQLLVQRISRKA